MTTFAADLQPLVENLPERASKHLQRTKDFVTEATHSLATSIQQARESVAATAGKAVNTVTQTTDKAADTVAATAQKVAESVTNVKSQSDETIATITQQAKGSLLETAQQTKSSLGQTLQTAQKLSGKTAEAIQMGVNSSVDQWLQAHPAVSRLVQLLLWAADHPIVSLVVFLFGLAIVWSLIRAIGHLIDTVGWSLLQSPLRLTQMAIRAGWRSLNFNPKLQKAEGRRQEAGANWNRSNLQLSGFLNSNFQLLPNREQRLAEIAIRLEIIQKEQCALLQEAAAILNSNKIDIKS